MRRFLDFLYDAAGYLAAFFMVALLGAVLIGIASREFGFFVRGTDAYAGYFMAATGFFSLAHTLKRGEHIRVTLLLHKLGAKAGRALELWSLIAGVVLAGAFAWFSARLAWQSHTFNDVSTGNDAVRLWIPQLAMAAGTLILLVAFIDEFVLELRRERHPPKLDSEPLHLE